MAGENETLQGGDAGTDTVVGVAGTDTNSDAAALKAVADQNGTTETEIKAGPDKVVGPGEQVPAEDPILTFAEIAARLASLETSRTEFDKVLAELTDKHTALSAKLEDVAKAVETLDPQSVSTITDAIKLFDDIKTLLPRLTSIEQKMKHFF